MSEWGYPSIVRQLHMAAQRNPSARTIELYMWLFDERTDTYCTMRTPVFDKADMAAQPERIFELTYGMATRLMDDLWAAGIRPAHGQNPSEVIAAKDAHIADLQKMVAKLMERAMPQMVTVNGESMRLVEHDTSFVK